MTIFKLKSEVQPKIKITWLVPQFKFDGSSSCFVDPQLEALRYLVSQSASASCSLTV
jgi:hypothetical protein